MNWNVIREYIPLYVEALGLTVKIGWLGIIFSIVYKNDFCK